MPHGRFSRARWAALCTRLGCQAAADKFDTLASAYSEPARAYHTAQHIDECLALLDSVADQLQSPDDVELAIWLHDVVYNPQAKDNEAQSAQLAEQWFASLAAQRLGLLSQRIVATQGHAPLLGDSDGQALLDIDLAILAATPARFAQYSAQVRHEYSFVEPAVYAVKRAEFLQHMAQRPRLYFHSALAARLEPSARLNLHKAHEMPAP
jgi:predicted metal-dependent HD superfamily phosphohydrolase